LATVETTGISSAVETRSNGLQKDLGMLEGKVEQSIKLGDNKPIASDYEEAEPIETEDDEGDQYFDSEGGEVIASDYVVEDVIASDNSAEEPAADLIIEELVKKIGTSEDNLDKLTGTAI